MRVPKIILFSLILMLASSACTKVIDYKLDEGQSRIVIDGTISNEKKAHKIKITRTSKYLSQEANPRISGAVVTISDGTNTYQLTEIVPGSGEYFTANTVQGEIGKTYTLTVWVDEEEYKATTVMGSIVVMDAISVEQLFEPIMFTDEVDSSWVILMTAQEPPTPGDNYMIHYFRNGVLETDTLREVGYTTDVEVNGNYLERIPTFYIDQHKVKRGDTITLQLQSVDKMYYDFVSGIMTETEERGGLFDGPAANVKGNISNGAMGFFNASAINAKSYVIP